MAQTELPPGPADVADAAPQPYLAPPSEEVRRTRISAAWVAVIVAVLFGVAMVDFIVQNTRSVRIEFFGASGHIPVAVALLAAALAGAVVVLAIGIARLTQLRLAARTDRKAVRARRRNSDRSLNGAPTPS